MKSETPSLFGPPDPYGGYSPPAIRHDAKPTSVEAADSVRGPTATKQRREVLLLLADYPEGLTDEEIQHALYMNPSSERPRRGELVDAGFVRDSGIERKTHSGRNAAVWVVTEAGQQEAKRTAKPA